VTGELVFVLWELNSIHNKEVVIMGKKKGSKIMRKRLIVQFIFLILFMFASTTAYAAPRVFLDGREVNFDVPSVIEDGRTLVPLRAIFSALGAEVTWDSDTQTVTAFKDNNKIELVIGGKAYINHQEAYLDVPAKIINGRTLVPLRFVSEALDCNVKWNNETHTILLASNSQKNNILEEKAGYTIFEADDFIFKCPEGWAYRKESKEYDTHSTIQYTFFPKNKTSYIYALGVSVDEFDNSLSLDQYIDINISEMKKDDADSDMYVSEISNAVLGGMPAKKISVTDTINDINIKGTIIASVKDSKGYAVLLMESYDANPASEYYEEAVNSFIIK
jgi:hypothetical protein